MPMHLIPTSPLFTNGLTVWAEYINNDKYADDWKSGIYLFPKPYSIDFPSPMLAMLTLARKRLGSNGTSSTKYHYIDQYIEIKHGLNHTIWRGRLSDWDSKNFKMVLNSFRVANNL